MASKKIEINYIRDFDCCDRAHFEIIKGISILAALIVYMGVQFWGWNGTWLHPVEGIAAAVFLFCSGYGVSESYERKGGLVHYWENKVIKVWIPSLVVEVLMSLIIYHNIARWMETSTLGLKGYPLDLQFGAYAAFWLLWYFSDSKLVRLGGLYLIAGIAFFFLPLKYMCVLLCFPTGALFSQLTLRRKMRGTKMVWKIAMCLVCVAITAIGWVLGVMNQNPHIHSAAWAVTCLFGAISLLLLVYTFRAIPIFGIFAPVGFMAFGIYLFYDYVLELIRSARDWQSVAIVIVLLPVIAGVFSWLRELLIVLNKNSRRRKRTHLKGSMW